MRREFSEKMTADEFYRPAMEIQTQEEADAYLEALIKYGESVGMSQEAARNRALHNIGFYTGFYGRETKMRVMKLFKTAWPVFGVRHMLPMAGEADGKR